MKEKGKIVTKLNEETWLWDLALLCDISHHLNELNTKFQGQQKLVYDMHETVRAFEVKLKLLGETVGKC
jgi:archaellum component FlaC